MLCAVCMSMFLGGVGGKHHATSENVQKASDNGCSICFLISYHNRNLLKYRERDCPLHYSFQGDGLEIIGLGWLLQLCFSEPEVGAGEHATTAFSNYVQSVKEDLKDSNYCSVRDSSLIATDKQQGSTGGTKAMEYAMSCLEECQGSHDQCRETSQAVIELQDVSSKDSWHPKRLIDCSHRDNALHLIHGKDRVPGEGYATLSYCWGTSKFFTLTLDREREVMSGRVLLDELPLAFREAMQVCNKLDIRYLWIDSICIVQSGDDGKDWLFHAREMSRIYSACLLNIAVEHTSHPSEGIFSTRQLRELIVIPEDVALFWDNVRKARPRFSEPSSRHTSPVDFSITRGYLYEISFAADITAWIYLYRTKLSLRGWVLQERLLSPRTLHFSQHRVAWSCYEHYTAEGCEKTPSSSHKGFRINKEILIPYSKGDTQAAENQESVWLWWKHLIEDYSQRQLSFPEKDKLVALAGVIHVFNNGKHMEYLAGIFRHMIHWSLLWEVDEHLLDDSQKITKQGPKLWTGFSQGAPSWSWASINAPVIFPLSFESPSDASTFITPLIEVKDTSIDLLDDQNPYGQVKSCTLLVRGLLISEKECTLISGKYSVLNDGRYSREGHDLCLLPTMRYREGRRWFSIYGLALQRHRQNEDESWSYYRVGTFGADGSTQFNATLEDTSRKSIISLV